MEKFKTHILQKMSAEKLIRLYRGSVLMLNEHEGHPWLNLHSGCTNVYKLNAYAGARGFNPEFRQYASRVSGPCGLMVVYNISPLNPY